MHKRDEQVQPIEPAGGLAARDALRSRRTGRLVMRYAIQARARRPADRPSPRHPPIQALRRDRVPAGRSARGSGLADGRPRWTLRAVSGTGPRSTVPLHLGRGEREAVRLPHGARATASRREQEHAGHQQHGGHHERRADREASPRGSSASPSVPIHGIGVGEHAMEVDEAADRRVRRAPPATPGR